MASARGRSSQIAEALLREVSAGTVEAFSAGSKPKPMHANAVVAMRVRGVDIATQQSKHLDAFARRRFDYVITHCDRVREVCPEFKGEPQTIHWSIPDPAAEPGSDEETYPAFERTAAEGTPRMSNGAVSVRYMVDAVEQAIAFCTGASHPLHRRGHRRRGRAAARRRGQLPQRDHQRPGRQADTGRRSLRQPNRALPLTSRPHTTTASAAEDRHAHPPGLLTIARDWGRIGCIGFGGPPAHIALLRQLCVEHRKWLEPREFEDAIAACNLLPGPASTQLAIFCAWRLRGRVGALVGGTCFIVPGLLLILALAALFLSGSPPGWIKGAGAGAGAAVAAVALQAGSSLIPDSWRRSASRGRWAAYLAAGAIASATIGPWLVLVLLAGGFLEVALQHCGHDGTGAHSILPLPLLATTTAASGGLLALVWVAVKVGALSYGGGFVIVPLMQGDAVNHYHWMTGGQFLNAVALGQVTPGPVVQTIAVVGYAAAGVGGGLLAALIAFSPSFAFVLLGGPRFHRLRRNDKATAFLNGAGPAAIGAILGTAIPLTRALSEWWQYLILAAAALMLFALRRGVVTTLLTAGAAGAIIALAGAALPH